MYASSIKPSLPYLSPLSSPCFLFSLAATLQSSSSPFLSLQKHCLSHSVDLSALSYTVRSPASHIKKFQHVCKFEMHIMTCTFVSVRSIKIFGIWPHIHIQTYTRVLQCCHASVGLTQARSGSPQITVAESMRKV